MSNQGVFAEDRDRRAVVPVKASTWSARRSTWIWCVAAVSLFAVALPAGAAADVPLGGPINVPVDGSKAYSPPLRAGVTYRVVATGTYTKFNASFGQRLFYDAAYCFDEQPARVGGCTPAPIRTQRFIVRFEGDPSHPFLDSLNPATQLPYDGVSHRYEERFTASRSGRLEAFEFDGGGGVYAQQGNITLQFYGPARKKKKRKKRIRGCPATRASGSNVRASRTCHWVVNFDITQSGQPRDSIPDPAARFVDSETVAFGKVFFNAEPRAGRTSRGSAAGFVTHSDTYQSPINPFAFEEGEVRAEPLTASYTLGRGEIRLRIDGTVTSVTGPKYSDDGRGRSTEPGDPARLRATHDFPRHHDDTLSIYFGCLGCGSTTLRGDHGHHFVVRDDAVLRATISRPKQLAGKCRCKA